MDYPALRQHINEAEELTNTISAVQGGINLRVTAYDAGNGSYICDIGKMATMREYVLETLEAELRSVKDKIEALCTYQRDI